MRKKKQFAGKLGEAMLKKFLESNFPTKIELDREISTQIKKQRNDIVNAKKRESTKSAVPSTTWTAGNAHIWVWGQKISG